MFSQHSRLKRASPTLEEREARTSLHRPKVLPSHSSPHSHSPSKVRESSVHCASGLPWHASCILRRKRWQLKTTRTSCQSSRRRATISPDQFCPVVFVVFVHLAAPVRTIWACEYGQNLLKISLPVQLAECHLLRNGIDLSSVSNPTVRSRITMRVRRFLLDRINVSCRTFEQSYFSSSNNLVSFVEVSEHGPCERRDLFLTLTDVL